MNSLGYSYNTVADGIVMRLRCYTAVQIGGAQLLVLMFGRRMKDMKLRTIFKDFHLDKVSLSPRGAMLEIAFRPADRDAAWELYIEMLTRIVTQALPTESGDEKTALDSIHALFGLTREILRRHGRGTIQFTKVAIPVLNQIVRPFTAKWHKQSLAGAFDNDDKCEEFRQELESLQEELRNYNRMLAEIAEVEDLTDLEQVDGI